MRGRECNFFLKYKTNFSRAFTRYCFEFSCFLLLFSNTDGTIVGIFQRRHHEIRSALNQSSERLGCSRPFISDSDISRKSFA